LKDLAAEQWINPPLSFPCSGFVTRACAAAGFEPHIAFETDDYGAVQGLVAAGVGIALIPELALTTVRDDIVIRTLGTQAPVRHVLAATLSGYRSPATDAMVDVLRDTSDAYVAERQTATAAKAS
jgi:DNA-binding transcriptional LysR family regulator